MKKQLFILLSLAFLLGNCCKKDEALLFCGVEEPIKELDWITEKIETLQTIGGNRTILVWQLEYGENKQKAIKIYHFTSYDSLIFPFDCTWYDCEGNIICTEKYPTCTSIITNKTYLKLIYSENYK